MHIVQQSKQEVQNWLMLNNLSWYCVRTVWLTMWKICKGVRLILIFPPPEFWNTPINKKYLTCQKLTEYLGWLVNSGKLHHLRETLMSHKVTTFTWTEQRWVEGGKHKYNWCRQLHVSCSCPIYLILIDIQVISAFPSVPALHTWQVLPPMLTRPDPA